MSNEDIQGREWGAYVALATFLSDGIRDRLRVERHKVTEFE